ncbi:hypothetical protein TRVA0_020S01640 [Trichomonascus vanleenenianus]|uniref:F-box protein n=1 Tax=Trichomonascus vanleenenianus TaxID=2268995 RepID=UPI003ECA5710
MNMLELPAEVQECVFSYLDPLAIIACASVTKKWRYYFLENDQRLFAPRLGIVNASAAEIETKRFMECVAPKTSLGFWFNQTLLTDAVIQNLNRKGVELEIKFLRPHEGFPRGFSSIIYRGSTMGQLPDTQFIGPYQFTVRYPPVGYPSMEGVIDVREGRIERHDYPIGPAFSVFPEKTPVVTQIEGYDSVVFDKKVATSISGYQAWVNTAITLADNRRYLGVFTLDSGLIGWHKVFFDGYSTIVHFVSGDRILAVASDRCLALIIDGVTKITVPFGKDGCKLFTSTHIFSFTDGVIDCCDIDTVLSERQFKWTTIMDLKSAVGSLKTIYWHVPRQQNVLNNRYICIGGHRPGFIAALHYLMVIDLVLFDARIFDMHSKRNCFWTMDEHGQVVATSLEVVKRLLEGGEGSVSLDLISMKLEP